MQTLKVEFTPEFVSTWNPEDRAWFHRFDAANSTIFTHPGSGDMFANQSSQLNLRRAALHHGTPSQGPGLLKIHRAELEKEAAALASAQSKSKIYIPTAEDAKLIGTMMGSAYRDGDFKDQTPERRVELIIEALIDEEFLSAALADLVRKTMQVGK